MCYKNFVKIVVLFFLNISFFSNIYAQLNQPTEPPEWMKSWESPTVPENYRSPAEPHKIIIRQRVREDSVGLMGEVIDMPVIITGQVIAMPRITPLNVYQYVGKKLYLLTTEDLNRLTPGDLEKMNIRDDMNLIRLRDRYFDTTIPIPEVPQNLRIVSKRQHQLHMVQFVGPVQNDWLNTLKEIKGIKIVTHIPENAYLIWANEGARKQLKDLVELKPFFQWQGPFHPAYRLHPGFDLAYSGEVTATVQMVTHENTNTSINTIKNKASSVIRETYRVGKYTNIQVKVPAAELVNISKLEDVVNVEPWIEPDLLGERQGQTVAGNLNAAGDGPVGPGYLNWLNGLRFNANFDFVVDVTDDGFDQGQTGAANVHEDFLDAAGNSRIAYVRRIAGTTVTTTNDENCGGHGTINASIVGGLNQTPAADPDIDYYRDGDGYYFGLGVAPFVRLGSSKIFNTVYLNPDLTTLIDRAYTDGARITSNSWGTPGNGSYTTDSQEYDMLVRDGRPATAPSGGTDGNQEMVIVFAAGNEGPNARTLRTGGPSAKNTITVGAGENFNNTGDADGCLPVGCCDNNDADDIRDVVGFSGRGPCDQVNGRVKPDIMAPGSHIFGAASQDGCFDGSSVCGDTDNDFTGAADDAYYPDDPDATDTRDQDLYTWSSGTSHSCPAVSGGAALLRQWFLNQGFPAPSPSMTKAYLMNTTDHMTGNGANDDLPSNNQGMGRMNLGMAFDNTNRLLYDQVKTCYRNSAVDASEVFTINGQVTDNTRPFRVTLAWTDAAATPGAGNMLSNDLDLEVDVGGNFYRGNDFTNAASNIGNVADAPDDLNNVESVFLPAGTAGNFTITVQPSGINEDALDAGGILNRQDFSLVVYNGEFPPRNPVDIILVLDRSGSMSSIAAGGTISKIQLLKDAVEMFIRSWLPFSIPEDRMGIVFFNNTITKYPNSATVLLPFQANVDNLITEVKNKSATGCTGLGAGILTAKRGFDTAADRQRHIIVFTNGMQNCSPMVTRQGGSHQILDDPSPSCCTVPGIADEPGVNLADYGVKAIHTIGTGVSSAQWINLLVDIAGETGGRMRFTSSPDEDLEDFFLETLVEALRVDPVEKVKTVSGTIARNQQPKDQFFSINSTARKATFILSWQGDRRIGALEFDLFAPGDPGDIEIPDGLITIKEGEFYRLASMDFPLTVHGTTINHSGTWKLTIKPQLQVPSVSYRAHLIVDDMDMRYHFELPVSEYAVGEAIPLSFWAQHGNRTIANLQEDEITVTIQKPPMGFGTFMSKHDVSKDQLDQLQPISQDTFPSLAAKKGHILYEDDNLRREVTPVIERIALYDDGNPDHGDLKAYDGVYSAVYGNTDRPGLYNFKFEASGNEPVLGRIHRSEYRSMTVGIKQFDFSKSSILLSDVAPTDGAKAYQVDVTLIDSYDNYLGPGHTIKVVVDPPGKRWGPRGREVVLTDDLDGSYSGTIELTENEVSRGDKLILDVNGTVLTSLQPSPRRFGLSFHSGLAVPSGNFANVYDQGVNYLFDANYWLSSDWALFAFVGYNDFKAKISDADDNPVWNLSLNLRYYQSFSTMPGPSWTYYVGGGPGLYMPDDGDTEFGFNIGAGVSHNVSSTITAEVGVDYHKTFDAIEFIHSHAGIIIRF